MMWCMCHATNLFTQEEPKKAAAAILSSPILNSKQINVWSWLILLYLFSILRSAECQQLGLWGCKLSNRRRMLSSSSSVLTTQALCTTRYIKRLFSCFTRVLFAKLNITQLLYWAQPNLTFFAQLSNCFTEFIQTYLFYSAQKLFYWTFKLTVLLSST